MLFFLFGGEEDIKWILPLQFRARDVYIGAVLSKENKNKTKTFQKNGVL